MENIRYWRTRHTFLRLEGPVRETHNKPEISLTGSSWYEAPNGHNEVDDPLEGAIYKASVPLGTNGRSGEIKIPSHTSKV